MSKRIILNRENGIKNRRLNPKIETVLLLPEFDPGASWTFFIRFRSGTGTTSLLIVRMKII